MSNKWMQLFIKLSDSGFSTKGIGCPECGQSTIDYCYIGDLKTNIGFLIAWCNSCNQGSRISRVGIPQNAKKLILAMSI